MTPRASIEIKYPKLMGLLKKCFEKDYEITQEEVKKIENPVKLYIL
jgi:hypothetical protein